MSILDRKPKHYSTSDLFWEPSAAPTDGAVGDVNTMKLDPSHLGMVQDMIIDTNGVLRNRGGFVSITSDSFTNLCITGVTQTTGATGLLAANTSGDILFYATTTAALTGFVNLTAAGNFLQGATAQGISGQATTFTSAKLPNDAGTLLGGDGAFVTSPGYSFLWGGNATVASDTIAGTAASTIGTKAIAGVGTAWTSALVGCYLFIGATTAANYVGQVAAVSSTTALTLVKGALKTIVAAAPAFKTVRPTLYNVYKGRITTNTTSAVVIGANTKFLTSGPASTGSTFMTTVPMNVFRYSDGAFVGQVTSVQNDTTLTLTGNAAIAMSNEEYFISCPTFTLLTTTAPSTSIAAGGVARYADRYWYGGFICNDPGTASTSLSVLALNGLAFTKKNDAECFDLDPASGDILTIATGANPDRIRALYPVSGGLLVFRTFDTFLVTGYSPETFRIIKIADDGVPSSISFQPYKEGVVWCGTKSVWYFDGTRIVDLLQNKMRKFYQRSTAIKPSANNPNTIAVSNDHLMVSYKMNTGTDQTWPYKNTTKSIVYICMVINMLNGAISFFTNIAPTTSFFSPNFNVNIVITRGQQVSLFNTTSFLLNGNKIFADSSTAADNFDAVTGVGTFTSVTTTQIGPDCMFESVKLTLGNAARLKFWKMLLMNYSSDVSMQATIIGTNDTTIDFPNRATGTATVVAFPVSSNISLLKRVKFLVRTPQLMLRVYQTSTTSSASQRFKLFWYAVGGKWMRWGRSQ